MFSKNSTSMNRKCFAYGTQRSDVSTKAFYFRSLCTSFQHDQRNASRSELPVIIRIDYGLQKLKTKTLLHDMVDLRMWKNAPQKHTTLVFSRQNDSFTRRDATQTKFPRAWRSYKQFRNLTLICACSRPQILVRWICICFRQEITIY